MSALAKGLRLPVALVAMLALAAATAAGCGDDESEGPEAGGGGAPTAIEGGEEGEVAGEATLSEVLESPFQFYGDTVTVSGEVSQVVVSPGVFTLGGSAGEQGEEGLEEGDLNRMLPVIAVQGAEVPAEEISEGTTVQVQGTLCQVVANLGEVEDEDFLFEEDEAFDDGFFTDFDQQPGLFASSIDADVPEEGGGGAGQDEAGGDQAQQPGDQGQLTVTVRQQGQPEDCPGITGGATTDGDAQDGGTQGGDAEGGATE